MVEFTDGDVQILAQIERGEPLEANRDEPQAEMGAALLIDRADLLAFLAALRDVLRTGDASDRDIALEAIGDALDTLRAECPLD
jgi:hypothetical protein